MSDLQGAIAAIRFGMGAKPGEIAEARSDPRGWLRAQLARPEDALIAAEGLPTTQQAGEEIVADNQDRRSRRRAGDTDGEEAQEQERLMRREERMTFVRDIEARNAHAVETSASFLERWVRFWSNHFTVSIYKPNLFRLCGPYEREAIRANAFGAFSGLLTEAVLHPAMLVYLDNTRSIGPSTAAARSRKMGLNENLARELLELHTLGVDGGYDQKDIEELAKALTGWTISAPPLRRSGFGGGVFVPRLHEPGAREVLGRRYAEDGAGQAKAILADLAVHPSTARHIATKLARHFVADDPPASAVARLEARFLGSGGDLADLAGAVIDLDEAWAPEQRKFKTSEELLLSAARGMGERPVFSGNVRTLYASLGQAPFGAPSPEGWPDNAAGWAGPDAVKKRLEWANRTALRAPVGVSAGDFLDDALGALATARTRVSVAAAESRRQGFTLALMSPEFQRR